MANKTYFKGNNKKRKNTKKYQFAGFDEAMQIDNTGYLNALYNPNYYDASTVSNEDIKQNVTADVATSQKLAMDAKVAKTGTETSLERLQRLKKEAEEKAKQQFSEANQQSKDQAIISSGTDLLTKGSDIAKQFMKPLAPATNAATTGLFSLPSNIGKFSTSGVQPGLQLGKQGISLGKGTFTSQMGTVGAKTGAEVGKQGFMSSLGSSTWATPGASATASGIGAGLSIGGKLWDTLSEDDNPYEYTKAEKWGDWGGNLLSDIGTYGGLGASVGGPIGAGIGAAVGAGIGTVKAIRESKKNKKQAADLNAKKAEEDKLYQEQIANYNNALASQQRFYDYTKRQLRSNVLTGEEQMRQNRLMQLTEGQLAGNTNMAMTGGGRKYFGKGGSKVPGGKVVPIGQGAVEFVGRKHSQGGIMLDSQTEVEGGETMDKVMMTGGEFNDYFFSDYLKNGGKSFAQHHKELIKRGASQKEIQALAKKQEAMANKRGEKDRSPSQVAEYGGIKKYQTGDFHQRIYTDPEEFKIANQAYQDSLEGFRKFPLLDGRGYGFSDNDISRPDFSSFNDPDTGFTNILNRDFANSLSICPSNMGTNCKGTTWVYKRPTEEPVYEDPDKIKYKPAPPLSVNLTPPPLRSNMMIESSPIGYRYQLHTGVKGSQVRVGYYKDGKYYPFSKERVQNEIDENRIPDQTEENYKKIQMQKQQQLKRNKTGGVKKYFTGGVRKYKTAGAVGDPPNKNISIEDFKKLDKYQRWELVYNIAKNLGDKFPELVASQFALESAWGTKPTGTWNFFGQTGRSTQNTKTLKTPRDPGGGKKNFINFNSLEEGIKYRVDNWSPMYKDAENVDEAISIILKLPGKTKSGKAFADLNTRGIYASGYPSKQFPDGDRGKVKDSLNNIISEAKKETNYTTLASPSPVSSKTEIPGFDFSRPPLPSGAVQSVPFFEEALLGLGRGAINLGRAGLNLFRKGTSQYFGESSSTPSTSTGLQTTRPNPQNIPLDYSVGNFTGNVARNPPFSYWEQIVENSAILKPNPTEALLRTANATRPLVNRKASEEAAKGDKETTGTPENVKTGDASYNYDFNIDYSPLNLPPLGANLPKPAAKTVPQQLPLKGTNNPKLPQAPPKLPVMKPALASLKEPPVDKNNLNYYLPILASAGAQAAGTLATVSKLKNIPAPTFPNYNVPLMQPIPTAPGMPPIGSTPQVNLGRVALDKERTAIDNTFTASTDFIKNNLAGPEAIPILLASQQKSTESLLKVADEEQRLNRDIREKETLVNVDISEKNRRASMDAYKQYTEGLLTTQQFNSRIAEANQRAMQEKYNYELEKNKYLTEFNLAKDMSIAGAYEKLGIGLGDTITSAANVYYENELAKDILKGTGVYNRNFQMGGPKKYFPSRLGDLKNRKLKVKA